MRNLGEKFAITCAFKPVGTTITGLSALVSATFDCWDQNENQILTAVPITHIQSKGSCWCYLQWVMLTGPGKAIQAAGTFTYQFTVNVSDGTSTIFQQVGLVNPVP